MTSEETETLLQGRLLRITQALERLADAQERTARAMERVAADRAPARGARWPWEKLKR